MKNQPQEVTLKTTGSSFAAMEKSVGSAVYIAANLESKQKPLKEGYRGHLCTSVCQRIIPPMNKVYLHVRSNSRDVRLLTLHENLVKIFQAFEVKV